MSLKQLKTDFAESASHRRKKAWKIASWIFASPFILFIGWMVVLPIVVMTYHGLSSHPKKIHGEHPGEFAGLFVNEDVASEKNIALALLPDGRVNSTRTGWGRTFWHVDGEWLYIDSFPANCTMPMPLRSVNRLVVEFIDDDRLSVRTELDDGTHSKPSYLIRTAIDEELWAELVRDPDEDGAWSFMRQFRIQYALSNAGVSEEDPSTWDDLQPTES